jgi:hypothetical protein
MFFFFSFINTKVGTRVFYIVFPPETIIAIVMQFRLNVGTQFFPRLRQTPYAGYLKLFAKAPELLTHAVTHLVVRKSVSSGVRSSEGHRDVSRRVLNRGCRESKDLIDISLRPNLRICCFDFINISMFRSEWTVGTSVQRTALTGFG